MAKTTIPAAKRKKHGPGYWLCWTCFDVVTNNPRWNNDMWITPPNYKSLGGKCDSCHRIVLAGEQAAKVTIDAPVSTF